MRLDKLLANMGFGSRKEVKGLLKNGAITVNGTPVKSPSIHVDENKDNVQVNGEKVEYREFIYLMMHKPPGLVSATEDKRDETVVDILQPEDRLFEPFPVGRLDKDTEGLLLLTNDGTLSHQLLSPKKHVQKLYYAQINGEVTEQTIKQFEAGVTLDDEYVTKPAILKILKAGPVSEIEIIITEGKFHQIKRMFEAVNMEVTYLKRLQMGSLKLDEDLQLGEYRELSDEELSSLMEHTKKS
ncbi:pseudouridine synthase [Terribacillus sp. DMT04]|uniref:pseudouridine synthase n=1 Tax=Terribacillus sp. DMT04 TaxID=2850441 RepID=UPI001C2C1E66|nr:pseudouridine synthase [Terribacillus sp. DMT04]QXE00746.1 rRNA pseudouridine synthase [Terribacillus sp. DMT04]